MFRVGRKFMRKQISWLKCLSEGLVCRFIMNQFNGWLESLDRRKIACDIPTKFYILVSDATESRFACILFRNGDKIKCLCSTGIHNKDLYPLKTAGLFVRK